MDKKAENKHMAKRISDKPVVDRSKYPKQLVFLDTEGYVCVADRPKGISEEEKAKRLKAREKAKAEAKQLRAKEREAAKAEREEEKAEKSKEAIVLRNAIRDANADYKEAVKTKDSRVIGKALDGLNEAQAEYNKFKGK